MTYDPNIHGFVAIGDHIFPIVFHLGDRVWIKATWDYRTRLRSASQVSDGLGSPFDEELNCVLAVPRWHITRYLEPAEAIAEEAAKEPREMLITRNMVTETGVHEFCAEASDLGVAVGKWPGKIDTDMGDGLPFRLWSASDAYAIYRQSNGVIVLQIFND